MKFVKNDLPAELDSIEIEIFSDLHLGSKRCDYNAIKERVERVKSNDNVYAIILGDVIDNATKNSIADTYEESLTPMQQVKKAIMVFEPIKEKILGVVSGNHCFRSYKTEGVDLLYFMSSELGIADKYDMTACLLFIRFGRQVNHGKGTRNCTAGRKICYSLYMSHGSGGGSTIGGSANKLQKRGQIIDADIICVGHTHKPMTFRETMFKVDPQNNSAYEKEQVFVNASATLDYEAYAETYGLKPNSKISPVIVLDGHSKFVNVRL